MPSDVSSIASLAGGVILGGYALTSLSRRNSAKKHDPSDYESVKTSYSNIDDLKNHLKEQQESTDSTDSVSDAGTIANEFNLDSEEPVGRVHSLESSSALLNTFQIATEVAAENSDLVFDFSVGGSNFESNSRRSNVKKFENRIGAGSIVTGAVTSGTSTSVVTTSDSVRMMLPNLFEISALNSPTVFHVALRGVDLNTLQQYPDYSALTPIMNSGFVVLLPATPQEVRDFAVLSHKLSKALNKPVANCFDGSSAFSTFSRVKLTTLKCESAGSMFKELGYDAVQYFGSENVKSVVVVYGSPSTSFVELVRKDFKRDIGVLVIRMLRPWSDELLIKALPKRVKRVCVVDFSSDGSVPLFKDVAVALHNSTRTVTLLSARICSKDCSEVTTDVASFVLANVMSTRPDSRLVLDAHKLEKLKTKYSLLQSMEKADDSFNQITIWDDQENVMGELLHKMAEKSEEMVVVSHASDPLLEVSRADFVLTGGRVMNAGSKLVIARKASLDVAQSVRSNGILLLLSEDGLDEEMRDVLDRNEVKVMVAKNIEEGKVFLAAGLTLLEDDATLSLFKQVVSSGVDYNVIKSSLSEIDAFNYTAKLSEQGAESKRFMSRLEVKNVKSSLKKTILADQSVGPVPKYKLMWNMLFPNAYKSKLDLRPSEHEVGTAIVTKFERLTPSDYERNIFHIEFDISNTDIKYEIGDALGVFGENDPVKVKEFIKLYKLDPEEVVKLPARGKMSSNSCEYTTVYNLLLRNLDLFGKVQKKFYVELAQFAEGRYEYLKLMHTGTDDAEQFKLGTYETVTYAELLLQYKTCKLSVADLINLIPEIKARHYSISSSMKMNPTSVHLLVVAVDWETPMGKRGVGQCTRYLKHLTVGQKVTVDIQKSVLRLPEDPKQPIVMAGLGTGMAPFRAFIQHRYWLLRNGYEIGPMVLYFGARHKAQEWLYGEELEKYAEMGLLRLGLAWSRDQKEKVYIQHKIKGDSSLLKEYLGDQKGYFYLCGPTWPVPDVRDALASGLDPEANEGKEDGELDVTVVEDMKEDGRYILEVY